MESATLRVLFYGRYSVTFASFDQKKYVEMLRDTFESLLLCIPETPEIVLLNDDLSEEELKRFPLLAALVPSRL